MKKKVRYKIGCIIIAIICYHYTKNRSKQKHIGAQTIYIREIMNYKKIVIKVVHVIISMAIKIEDFHFDNILLGQKSYENILIYDAS